MIVGAPVRLDDLVTVNRGRDAAGNLVISVPDIGLVCSFSPAMGPQPDLALECFAFRRVQYFFGRW